MTVGQQFGTDDDGENSPGTSGEEAPDGRTVPMPPPVGGGGTLPLILAGQCLCLVFLALLDPDPLLTHGEEIEEGVQEPSLARGYLRPGQRMTFCANQQAGNCGV